MTGEKEGQYKSIIVVGLNNPIESYISNDKELKNIIVVDTEETKEKLKKDYPELIFPIKANKDIPIVPTIIDSHLYKDGKQNRRERRAMERKAKKK